MSVQRIIDHLSSLPPCAGVYRMTDRHNKDLYIGKAKNLAKRVASYTRLARLSHRLRQMVCHVDSVRILTTDTESEALILEAQLIKKHRPAYNILLKDRNAFSYVSISDHPFPQIYKNRHPSKTSAPSFGPFLSYASMKPLMDIIHNRFQLRSCSDDFFKKRTRPCLQYYIKRCSAPCVHKISQKDYAEQVEKTIKLLRGKTQTLIHSIEKNMEKAALVHHYEKALALQKQIQSLRTLDQKKDPLKSDDLIVIMTECNVTCLHITSFRHSTFYGSENFFFHNTSPKDQESIISSFLKHFYTKNSPPRRLAIPFLIEDIHDVKTMAQHYFGHKPHCFVPKKGRLKHEMDKMNRQCQRALKQYLCTQKESFQSLSALYRMLSLIPQSNRIEIYDNSHHQGSSAFSAMVVVNKDGFSKKDYRLFCMDQGSDDYEMMRQAIRRRFGHTWPHPDIIMVDGGKGQVSAAQDVLRQMNLNIPVIGLAKASPHDRLIDSKGNEVNLSKDDPNLHTLQRWRDEAHRFAIRNHRIKKEKSLFL